MCIRDRDDSATGTITGMTHGTKPAHLERAALEAIAHQIADVFEAMELDIGSAISGLKADGGASSNGFLMQIQADVLGRTVQRNDVEEVGALGVASMALGRGFTVRGVTEFSPVLSTTGRAAQRKHWTRAVTKTRA